MSYPSSHSAGSAGYSQNPGSTPLSQPGYRCQLQVGSQAERDHQLEKLEFALAVALTNGDIHRSAALRDQIAALGGNLEEPGT